MKNVFCLFSHLPAGIFEIFGVITDEVYPSVVVRIGCFLTGCYVFWFHGTLLMSWVLFLVSLSCYCVIVYP